MTLENFDAEVRNTDLGYRWFGIFAAWNWLLSYVLARKILFNSATAVREAIRTGKMEVRAISEPNHFFLFESTRKGADTWEADELNIQIIAALDAAEKEGRVVWGARMEQSNRLHTGRIVQLTGLIPVKYIPDVHIGFIGDRDAAWQAWFGRRLKVVRHPGGGRSFAPQYKW